MQPTQNIIQLAHADCKKVHIPKESPSRIPGDHRYGMFVVLKPNAESTHLLRRLTDSTSKVFQDAGLDAFKPTESSNFHLTVASPLIAMNDKEVKSLLQGVADRISSGAAASILRMDRRDRGGNCFFQFGASDGNPYVTLKMFKDADQREENKQAREKMEAVASTVNELCKQLQLFSQEESKEFNPHVTIGRFPDESLTKEGFKPGYVAHLIESHASKLSTQGPRIATLTERVRNAFNDARGLIIEFNQMDVLLVDKDKGEKHSGYHTVASLDLTTKKISLFPIPPCKHQEQLLSSSMANLQISEPVNLLDIWNRASTSESVMKTYNPEGGSIKVELLKRVCPRSGETLYAVKDADTNCKSHIFFGPYDSPEMANMAFTVAIGPHHLVNG